MKRHVDAGMASFVTAKPIWPEGMEREKNLTVGFRTVFDAKPGNTILRVTASSVYRAWLNGEFLGYGPARGPHGYYRIDEWDISGAVANVDNLLAIEVCGHNVNSFYTLDQPSFLQAEITCDGTVLAATNGDAAGFQASMLRERVQKTQRYSFQRPFTEMYRLERGHDGWKTDPTCSVDEVQCAVQEHKKTLQRGVPYPRFSLRSPLREVSTGTIRTGVEVANLWNDLSMTGIGPRLGGFAEEELEEIPSIDLQKTEIVKMVPVDKPMNPDARLNLEENSFRIFDFGTNLTGFIGARVSCRVKTKLLFVFDEMLVAGDVDFKRLGCVNIVSYDLEPGVYEVESMEPYTLRYLKALVVSGDCEVENIHLREYANSSVYEAHFSCSDQRISRIFEAGRETYRQNALDVFMDCPSRERGGYLCDGFFTARVAPDLSGDTAIERNFFENYLLAEKYPKIPDGMLPMCYPADHYDGLFIPNWALWFVVQLEEYYARSGDRQLVDDLKTRVFGLFDYLTPFRNDDGLLEKLDSWVFIEWSKANDFVQDVSYPTNMLYAKALDIAGRLYNMPELADDAGTIRDIIRQQSFDGAFFVDNAVRKDRRLEVTGNRSEVCQYYAFFFDIATPETHAELWHKLVRTFGPRRKAAEQYPEIHVANSFIGYYLRFDLLSRYGVAGQLLDEMREYFLPMAELTGTLWEHSRPEASCNHGFASHVVHMLYRDILGLREIDYVGRRITLRFNDVALEWCKGRIPLAGGFITLEWRKEGGDIHFRTSPPAGFSVHVESGNDLKAIQDY